MTWEERHTDEELLWSVLDNGNLEAMVAHGQMDHAWAMGATWANNPLLGGTILGAIRAERELIAEATDEELTRAIMRRIGPPSRLECRAKERRDAACRDMWERELEHELLERERDSAKMAEYEAEMKKWMADVAEITRRMKAGEPVGERWDLVEDLRRLRADGHGHRWAVAELEQEDADRKRRVNLVEDWLAERLPRDQCPPWAEEIFAAARR